jgi:hypothetical protein
MEKKKDSPQKAALREMMGNYLKENNVKIKDGIDVNSIMREFQDRDIVQQHQLKYLTVSYEKLQN